MGTVVHWFALLPHNKKAMGLNLPADWDLSVPSVHVLLVPRHSGFLPQSAD